MPTYSFHCPEAERATLDKAITEQAGGKEGPWLKEAVRQRLEREGYLPDTPEHTRREKREALLRELTDAEVDALYAQKLGTAA